MTAKEKAKQLVEKFIEHTQEWDELDGYVNNIYKAKKCALIAVDEILEAIPNDYLDECEGGTYIAINEDVEYWQQVKQEIQNL
jgi:hypothetical protein